MNTRAADRLTYILLVVCIAATVLVVQWLNWFAPVRVEAKTQPEPVTCDEFAIIGAQHLWKCEDTNGVVCYVNNYSFMQCVLP